jgi:hypothetical protein
MSNEINLWSNKKMQNFDQNKKRKLLANNLFQIRAVDNFCDTLIKIIRSKYKNGRKGCLNAAERLDYLQRFCEGRKLRNEDIRKACKKELIETHVSGVLYEQ